VEGTGLRAERTLSDQKFSGLPVPSLVIGKRAVPFNLFDATGVAIRLDGNFDPDLDSVVYVHSADSMELLKWGEQHVTAIAFDDSIPLPDRAAFVYRGLLLETSRLFQHRARFSRTQDLIRSLSVAGRFMAAHPQTIGPTLQFARELDAPVPRSTNTGFVNGFLAIQSGQERLAGRALLAGIVADIGVVDSHRKLMTLDRALTPPERNIIQAHPVSSARLLDRIGIHDELVIDAVLYHHERLDGSGYPSGLADGAVPRMAQLTGLANAFIGLTTPRGKRSPMTSSAAIQQLSTEPFDPNLVDLLRPLGAFEREAAAA